MLDEFLEYTCKTLDIPGSQYNILQKVFAYFEAYEQEKRILENMVNNYITRSSEQEDRLTFLQKEVILILILEIVLHREVVLLKMEI